jgi:ATP adenylyltransferase
VLSFAAWHNVDGSSPVQLVRDVVEHCSLPNDRIVWFEHGPAQKGTAVGCGVDQAHLHLIYAAPFSAAELQAHSSKIGNLNWTKQAADTVYETIDPEKSYYAIGTLSEAALVQDIEHLGSQFLRRAIAEMAGAADAWDYRTHAHLTNVGETVRTFQRGIH